MVVMARRSGGRIVSSSSLVFGFLLSASLVLASSEALLFFVAFVVASSAWLAVRRTIRQVRAIAFQVSPRRWFAAETAFLRKNVRVLGEKASGGSSPSVIAIVADVGEIVFTSDWCDQSATAVILAAGITMFGLVGRRGCSRTHNHQSGPSPRT